MNYEFDPTLTGGAQNSYAEGMAEPGRGAETNQNADAEAEEAAKAIAEAKARKAQAEADEAEAKARAAQARAKMLESSPDRQEERFDETSRSERAQARQKINERQRLDALAGIDEMEASGRFDPAKLNELRKMVKSAQLLNPLQQLDPIINNDRLDEATRREALIKANMLAKQLDSVGLADSNIRKFAAADPSTMDLSQAQKLFEQANEDNKMALGIDDAQDKRPMVPGSMPSSSEDMESYMDMYYPPSLEDVAQKAMDLESEEWKPGGEHEIVDRFGELKLWNLRRWMEEKWLKWGHQLSPDSPEASPWQSVAVLSLYTQIDLMRLLTTSRYWLHKEFDHMDYRQVKDPETGEIKLQPVPRYKYEKSEAYENLRADLLDQFWLFGKAHEWDARTRPLKGDEGKYMETIAQLYGTSVWLQGQDRLTKAWKKDATSGSEKQLKAEYDSWMEVKGSGGPIKEGRAGRAHRQADALYFRMAHLEKWNDGGEDYITRMRKHYNYSDNKFYEILGPEGVKAFYTSFINRGLPPMEGKFKGLFSELSELEGLSAASIMFSTDPADIGKAINREVNQTYLRKKYTKEVLAEIIQEEAQQVPENIRKRFITERMRDLNSYSLNNISKFVETNYPQIDGEGKIVTKDGKIVLSQDGQMLERQINEGIARKMRQLLETAPQEAMRAREAVFDTLTGWDRSGRKLDIKGFAGFKDKGGAYVRSLFDRAKNEPMALEELALRFFSLEVGDKNKSSDWESGVDSKKWIDAWKNTRKEMNMFNAQSKTRELDDAMRRAVRDAIGEVNDLDDFDAEYAENFAFAKVYFTFTSGYNDTSATGFDAATKLMRFMDYRKNNVYGANGPKNYVGHNQNIPGVKRLLLTLWEGAYGSIDNTDGSRKKASLLNVLENGFTDKTRGQDLQKIDFNRLVESTFGSNHIMNAFKLYQRVLKGPVFDFAAYAKVDNYGNVQTDPKALNDIQNEVLKPIRYMYSQLNLDFEDIEDEVEIVWEKDADGKMSSTPVFNKRKLKDALFAQEVVNMGMYERREFIGTWVNKKIGMKDTNGEDMLTDYARNVLAYYAAKEILEHRLYNPKDSSYNYNIWELDMIRAIEGLFANIASGELEEMNIGLFNKNKKLRKTGSFFDKKEFKKIRLMGNAGYGKLWLEELRAQLAESGWKGNTGTANKFFAYIFQDMWSFK